MIELTGTVSVAMDVPLISRDCSSTHVTVDEQIRAVQTELRELPSGRRVGDER